MLKRIPQDWEALEQELHAAGVSQAEIEAGARRLLAEAKDTSPPSTRANSASRTEISQERKA
jgi:hypothetical protein